MSERDPLYEWQTTELANYGGVPKRAIFASPRLGKTRLATEELSRLPDEPPLRGLVVCPLVVAPQWENELDAAGLLNFPLYSGTRNARRERLFGPGIGIINDDVLADLYQELARWGPDALVGDESHRYKTPGSKRGKAFRKLAWQTPWVRILTGTPTPNHYGDLWGQMVALDPEAWGKSYERFAQRYLIRDYMFPSRVLGYRNLAELQEKMLRYASVIRREDVFGPDSWQIVRRSVTLPPAARHIYNTMAQRWFYADSDWTASADHVLTRLTRLQQITSGYLPNDEGEAMPVHTAKLDAVMADLDEIVQAGEKAVIFHRFRWEGEHYQREAQRICPVTWRISGDTPAGDRAAIIERFRDADGSRVAVVQTQAGGLGISFATATHAMFVSRGFSFTDDEQARDRVYSPGARRVATYYEASNTVDEYISRVLAFKQDVHQAIRNADREELVFGRKR